MATKLAQRAAASTGPYLYLAVPMKNNSSTLTPFERHSLFEACSREAMRLGGDERTADYFFTRAQSSRIWLSKDGAVTVADMDFADWCSAIAWSAPAVGQTPKQSRPPLRAEPNRAQVTSAPDKKQPRSGARAKSNTSG